MNWWLGYQGPGLYVEAQAASKSAFIADNPGTTQVKGPFNSQAALETWQDKNPGWPSESTSKPGGTSGNSGNGGWFVISTATTPSPSKTSSGLTVQYFTGKNYIQALAWVPDGLAWGPYSTKAAANAELADIRSGKVKNPAGVNTGPVGASTNPLQGLDDLAEIPKYIAAASEWLSNRNNWIRIAKVVIGAGLIFMGIQQLKVVQRGETTIVNAGKIASTAALV
jgi:hypothetical protein